MRPGSWQGRGRNGADRMLRNDRFSHVALSLNLSRRYRKSEVLGPQAAC
jgi:hypothetical protein